MSEQNENYYPIVSNVKLKVEGDLRLLAYLEESVDKYEVILTDDLHKLSPEEMHKFVMLLEKDKTLELCIRPDLTRKAINDVIEKLKSIQHGLHYRREYIKPMNTNEDKYFTNIEKLIFDSIKVLEIVGVKLKERKHLKDMLTLSPDDVPLEWTGTDEEWRKLFVDKEG